MKVAIIALVAIVACQARPDAELYQKWANFQKEFGKSYKSTLEAQKRMNIFKENLDKIEAHNALYSKGEVTWFMGLTSFSDWSSEEFKQYVNKNPYSPSEKVEHFVSNLTSFKAPASVDYRRTGAVSEVKNQGQCGACWSFSATGAIEGQYALVKNMPVSLSEQQLIDCARAEYNCHGCDGGTMTGAFLWTARNGLRLESDYPYVAAQHRACGVGYSPYKVSNVFSVLPTEDNLRDAVAQIGPISVAIESTENLQNYYGGIIYDPLCSGKLNHGVLAVGYGTQSGQDYWIVKNSWGTQWGEGGFFRLARNSGNNCGIATDASFPRL